MPTVIRTGAFEVRLAREPGEVRAAQALRYRVFVEAMGAAVDSACHAARLDVDRFDAVCDHLVVIEAGRAVERVLGCYRLLRREIAHRNGGFYSAAEFSLGPLDAPGARSVEVGRACVDPAWRHGPVVQLLWRGIAEYLEDHRVDLLFGCASLPGTDVVAHAPMIAWLQRTCLAPRSMRPQALRSRRARIDLRSVPTLDDAQAQQVLPPLIRGYLRLGAMVGDGAVVDQAFNTTDLCVVLPTERVAARYRRPLRAHAGGEVERQNATLG